MTYILNLTQHPASAEQIAAGVEDVDPRERDYLTTLLTVDALPDRAELQDRAEHLAELALMYDPGAVMIGGAPFLMAPLEKALRRQGLTVLYAFSRRECAEEKQPDGSVRKVQVFKHLGFVEV